MDLENCKNKFVLSLKTFGIFSLLVACRAKPQVTTSIESCGGEAKVDAAPGVLQEIKAPGMNIKFIVNLNDGSITYFSEPPFTDIPPVEKRPIGILNQKHLEFGLLGDTDGNGWQDILVRSVCPVSPKPTLSPQPPATPTGYLKGPGRLASLPNGFHPNPGKPALSRRI